MAKNSVRDFDATAANNTDIQSVDIAENCAPSGINNAIRELMADIKDVSAGTVALESPQADSMTVTGDLTVDTNTLYVDSTNNRVGVGTASPTQVLTVKTATDANLVALNDSGVRLQATNDAGTSLDTMKIAGNPLIFLGSGGAETARIDSSGNVGIGTSSPGYPLHVSGNGFGTIAKFSADDGANNPRLLIYGSSDGMHIQRTSGSGASNLMFEVGGAEGGGTEAMRIDSSGNLLVGKTTTAIGTAGSRFISNGQIQATASGNEPYFANRLSSDGVLFDFRKDGATVGSISVSGGVVSYNAFSGSHWGRLADNSKPTILRGTVIESIGTMIDWYQVEFDVDIGGEVVTNRRNITKPANVEDGDTFDYVVSDDDATPSVPAGTYTGTLRLEDDEKHPHVKISDTLESKAVYGVFMDWDNDDDTVNDMYVNAVGTGVVRILSTETVAIGDLLDSNGDGTAKVQSDDVVRSRTIGKVISTVKQETYSDGSYTVPCAICCG